MPTTKSVIGMLLAWMNFRLGMRTSAGAKLPVNKRRPIALDYPDDSGLPANLPSPESIRRLAAHLAREVPVDDALALVRRKEYPLIHELSGYHDAVAALHDIADQLDDAERDSQKAQSVHL
jgi:hypothetical protein